MALVVVVNEPSLRIDLMRISAISEQEGTILDRGQSWMVFEDEDVYVCATPVAKSESVVMRFPKGDATHLNFALWRRLIRGKIHNKLCKTATGRLSLGLCWSGAILLECLAERVSEGQNSIMLTFAPWERK